MIGFIHTLYTPLGTRGNYSAITIPTMYSSLLHALLSSDYLLHSPLVVSWQQNHESHCNFKSHTKCSLHSLIPSCHCSQSSSTADSLNFLLQFPTLKLDSILILAAWDPRYIASGRTHRKHRFLYWCLLIHCCRDVSTAQLRSNKRGAGPQRMPLATPLLLLRDAFLCRMYTSCYLVTAVSLPHSSCFDQIHPLLPS
jgi:hypothetical protein